MGSTHQSFTGVHPLDAPYGPRPFQRDYKYWYLHQYINFPDTSNTIISLGIIYLLPCWMPPPHLPPFLGRGRRNLLNIIIIIIIRAINNKRTIGHHIKLCMLNQSQKKPKKKRQHLIFI